MQEFSIIAATITSALEGLFKAQESLVELMCKECDIPVEFKPQMVEDMNNVIGVKKL